MNTCLKKYGKPYALPHYIKEQCYQWKGGPKSGRSERQTYEYHQWRKLVFERDNYTCQACLSRSQKGKGITLNAHHILNWKDNTDKRYDVDNGITLCTSCQYEFHKKYSHHNNTQEQINEFVAFKAKRYAEQQENEPVEVVDKKQRR